MPYGMTEYLRISAGFLTILALALTCFIILRKMIEGLSIARDQRKLEAIDSALEEFMNSPESGSGRSIPKTLFSNRLDELLYILERTKLYADDQKKRLLRETILSHDKLAKIEKISAAAVSRVKRISAIKILGKLGSDETVRLIRNIVDASDDPDIIYAAIQSLGTIDSDISIKALMSLLGLDKFPNSRIAAVLDAPRHTALKSIIERKDDTSKIVRFWVASLLGHYKDEASFRSLETMLKDEDPNVRAAACESLGNIGDKRAIGLVHNMLGDEYWFVRLHAIKALGEFLDTESIDKIIPSLRDKNWWVRYNAKSALKKIGLNVAPHIYPVLDDEDRFARNSAAEILEDIGAMDILLKDILERHVSEEKIRKDLVNFVKSEGFLWLRSRLEKLNSEDRRKILGIIEKEDKKIYAEIIKNMLVTAGER